MNTHSLPSPYPPCQASSGGAWYARAGELADWTLARLVNRVDAWGAYRADGGQLTRRGELSRARLVRHFQAQDAGDIIGLHTADRDNRSKAGALDIDQHGDDPQRAEANRCAALHWYEMLTRQGFRPLLYGSNGNGGYHLRVLLAEPIDAAGLFHFLRRLTADHRRAGLDKPPEQFPKQPDVRKCEKGLGNWIRLPGRHHKRDYWSDVWEGGEWVEEDAAVDFLLSLTGDDPALIPNLPPPATRRPVTSRRHFGNDDNLSARISAYLRRLPNLSEGQGRDDVAYSFACFLVRDLAIPDTIALEWLELWDAGNTPPKGRERLAEILQSAHAYGQRAIGCGLPAERPRYDRHGHRILRATAEVD